MGISKSVVEFAKKMEKVQQVPAAASKAAVKANAAIAKANAEAEVRSVTGGSGRLRNAGANVRAGTRVVGVKGASLTVSAKIEHGGQQAFVKAVGPWQLIEYPTKQHFIGPAGVAKTETGAKSGRASAKARTGRAKALRTPYGLKRWVYVHGTKGQFPWAKAAVKTAAEVPGTLQKVTHDELAKALS